jgi:DNA-directed RNA polymerase subunit RPC12/RpoP
VTARDGTTLTCVECGRAQAAGERGWRTYLTVDEDEPAEAVVYCPDCASREFQSEGTSGWG